MTAAWLDPIEIQGNVPHRILVVSENREDYYGTVRLCLDQGQNMEVIFKTYDQIPLQGAFDLVVLFPPSAFVAPERLDMVLTRGQAKGCVLVIDEPVAGLADDPRIRRISRSDFPRTVRTLLLGREG